MVRTDLPCLRVGCHTPKVDKPLSPQAKGIASEPLKPQSPKGAQNPAGAKGAPTSHSCTTLSHVATHTSPRPEPTDLTETSPPRSRSYGLGAPGGPRTDEGSSMPQFRRQP
jgi:hypothetical protein